MSKKRNYENYEEYRNFKLEDYLPSMNDSEPKQETATDEATLFPPQGESGTSTVQAAMPEAIRENEVEMEEEIADDTDEKVEATVAEAVAPVERSIARRISSKQRKLSLEEYRASYLQVPKITNRKPVFVSGEVRDKLDEIIHRIGGRGMSVSGMIENLVRQHLEVYRKDIEQWRKL